MATESEQAELKRVLWDSFSPVIVELGAHQGEDEEWIRSCCKEQATYLMVEPDIRNCQIILNKPTNRNRRLIIGAVAGYTGTSEFYGSVAGDVRGSGSIRKPTLHRSIFPVIQFPEELHTKVPCFTLDRIFDTESLSKITLLWVDVQGAERDMIAGGTKALAHTRYLFIETAETELYEGMALKKELLAMLPNWYLVEEFDCNCLLANSDFSERPGECPRCKTSVYMVVSFDRRMTCNRCGWTA